ncbi:MAG: Rid family hydrolase [Pirellulales bacterium]
MNRIRRKASSPRYADLVVYQGVARWVEVASDTTVGGAEQISQILQQIDAMLNELDSAKSDLLEVIIYLSDLKDVPALNEAWDAWIDPQNPPSRACVGVALQGNLRAEFVIRAACA